MRTAEEIVNLLRRRMDRAGSTQIRMEELRRIYNGELETNLPELQENERAAAANLVQLGTDQMAMRLASTVPAISFYPDRISDAAKNRARDRRDITMNWWAKHRLTSHVLPKRGRWFFGYATAPVLLRPDADGLPCWYARDPIGAYPASVAEVGNIVPPDTIFTYKKDYEELRSQYPDQMYRLLGNDQPSVNYDVIEYVDAEQITVIVVAGPPENQYIPQSGTPFEVLHWMPNRVGRPLAVMPGRITLDKPLGQFDGLLGAYQLQATLMALYTIAQKKAIFPEVWIESAPGTPQAKVIVQADAMEGIVGEIQGGSIQKIDMSPPPVTGNLLDRLEYIERASGAIPAEFGGMSGSNIRTGQRGGQVMGAAIDFRLQEAQSIFEASLVEENKIAMAIARTYAGPKSFSIYVPGRGNLTYTPNTDLEHDDHEVRYAYAGADANGITIATGQKLGLETMSRFTAMTLDPMIQDVEIEMDRITAESVKRAFLHSIETLAADPNAPWQPVDFARLGQLVESNAKDIYGAAQTIHQEVQDRQQQAQQGQLQGAEAQPGLSMPGAPGAPPPIQDVAPSLSNMSDLMSALRRPQSSTPAERRPLAQPAGA